MANFSATSSGDFSSYLAGKVFNAANMAKGEKNRREEADLEQAQPGSLFGKALQSEFGGDLYSRTFGIFDPRKSHGETDRNSSKEARFTAQFPEAKEKDSDGGGRSSGSSQEVERAKQDLLRDDEKSVPVQDKNLRRQFSKIFGSIDVKLLTAEAKIEQSSSKLSVLHQDVLNTQKLILDQNAVLEAKFDQILAIFDKQIEFQKELAEDAKVKAKENELEEGQNRSTTRGLIATGTAGGDLSTTLLGFLGRRLGKAISKQVRRRLGSKAAQKGAQKGAQRAATTLATRGATSAAENAAGKALRKSNLAARALRSPAVRKALVRKLGAAGAKKLTTKIAAKLIPGISTAYGLGEGLTRIALGDVKGGFLSFGSAIPLAGYGFAAIDIFRDIDVDAYTKHIEPNLPAPSDENVGAFFAEALGVTPNQYEQGTARSRRGLASPGPAMLHGKEAILTPEDRRRITQFSVDSINATGSKMVSTAVAFGDSSGNGSTVRSIFNKLGVDYPLERVAFRFDVGKKSSGGFSISKMFSDAAAAVASMVGMNNEDGNGNNRTTGSTGEYTGLTGLASEYYQYLRSKGLSPNHAMGIVINAERESGFNHADQHTDTNGLQVGGVLQWNGGRFDAMVRAVPDWKTNWKAQLDYIWDEPSNLSGYTIDEYKAKTFGSALDAANDWMREWERPQDPSADAEKHARIYSRYVASGLKQNQSGEYNFYGNFSPPTGDARITLTGGQGIDRSGEPGVDFSAADFKNNYAVFAGKVVNSRHTPGYGWDVIVRSDDPNNPGKKFDALYAHFPNKESIKVKSGDQVRVGQHLGPVGWNEATGKPFPEAGSMRGWHTSLDFYPVDGPYVKSNPYPGWRQLADGIIRSAGGSTGGPPAPPTANKPPGWTPQSTSTLVLKQEDFVNPQDYRYFLAGGGNAALQEGQFLNDVIQNGKKAAKGRFSRTGGRGGTGGPGNWLGTQWNRFTNFVSKPFKQPQGLARGTRGVRAGFTGMNAQGFNAMMRGENFIPSNKPQILGRGAYSSPTVAPQGPWWNIFSSRGAQRYAGATGSLGGRQLPGGVVNSIVPGTAPRINILEPQMKVDAKMFNRGRDLATRLMQDPNFRPNSALANRLRTQIRTGGVSGATPKTPSLRGFRGRNLLTLLPMLMQFAPGSVGDYFRKANDRMAADREAAFDMSIEQWKKLTGQSGSRRVPPAALPPNAPSNRTSGELYKQSALMEDMEDAGGTRIQYVIINNTVPGVQQSRLNRNGTTTITKSTSLSELYLASLGA